MLKKVINTKYHSIKQMENMAHNLREKFNIYCSVSYSITFNAHDVHLYEPGGMRMNIQNLYAIYIKPKPHHLKSWQELLQHYHKLMR